MNAMSFFEKISGLQRKREQKQDQQYSDVVRSLVMGKEPDPEEVDRILSEAGITVSQFQADVEKGRERMTMHALANSLPNLQANRDEIAKQIKAVDTEFAKAEKAHDDARLPLEDRLRECDEAIKQATRAREDLVVTCEDPVLLGEMEHVESELERLREVNRDLLSKAAYFENLADTERNMADKETGEEKSERLANAKEFSEEAKAVRKRMKANDKLSEGLQLKRSEIEERMRAV